MLGDEKGPAHMVSSRSLSLPLSPEDVASLKTGDIVLLNGALVTGRDKVHKYLVEQRPRTTEMPFDLAGAVLYHCGPIMRKTDGGYAVVAAGPTTSIRVEMYEAAVIKQYGLRGIMGKGGMGDKTLRAMQEAGCVYLHTIGGAAAYLADRIIRAVDVWKLEEFGTTEAMWLFEVDSFPAIVTMDAHGNSMHNEIEDLTLGRFKKLIGI